MKKILGFLLFASLSTVVVFAQYNFEPSDIVVQEYGSTLDFPYAAGFELPQYWPADLNNDGVQDLAIFDKFESRMLTFLGGGTPGIIDLSYAPEFEANFPQMIDWATVIDFDCDGIADLFTSNDLEVVTYKGHYDAAGRLAFTLFKSLLTFGPTNEPLDVVFEDIPGFADMNGDGDLDILVNDDAAGTFLEYYENQSMELGYGCDSLIYERLDYCWGEFFATVNAYTLDTCPPYAPVTATGHLDDTRQPSMHFSKNVLPIDMDGDNDKDILIGSNLSGELHYLENGGTSTDADIVSYDLNWPPSNPATLEMQISPFWLDMDNDGLKDLVCSKLNQGMNVSLENVHWFYKNTGTNAVPNFSFQTDIFLDDKTIDVGTYSRPVFQDINGDGLTDLLIANEGFTDANGMNISQLFYYKNTGTSTQASFELVTQDFQTLSAFQQTALHPCFGDIDGDGDDDMICGNSAGELIYFANNGGNFSLNVTGYNLHLIDVGQYATPVLFDFDSDGDLDLIVGEKSGGVNYFENTGTAASATFVLQTSGLYGANFGAYSVPFVADWNGSGPHIFLATEDQVSLYGDYQLNFPVSSATQYSSSFINDNFQGKRLALSGADLNGDGMLEFAIGTSRGGIIILEDRCPSPQNVALAAAEVDVLDIIWDPVASSSQFVIEYRQVGESQWQSTTANVNGVSISSLQACTSYEVRLSSTCSSYQSGQSITYIFSTASPSAALSGPVSLVQCGGNFDLLSIVAGDPNGNWLVDGTNLSGNVLDPLDYLPGNHTLTYSHGTPTCVSSSVNLEIQAAPNANWNFVYLLNCGGPYDLNQQLTNTTGGSWSGSAHVTSSGIFDPTGLPNGVYPVTYEVGSGSCQDSHTENVYIQTEPVNVSWTSATVSNCDLPYDLNVQVTGDTGGSWSGGSYISPAGMFDPSGLAAGSYPVTYTVEGTNCTHQETNNVIVGGCGVNLQVKVLLQGPYDWSSGLMYSSLVSTGIFPLSQPYSGSPWNYNGSEVIGSLSQLAPGAIDWVLVELRDASNPNNLREQKAGILMADGTIVNTANQSGLSFESASSGGSYYVVVRHRNHLDVMSSSAVAMNGSIYDFTSSPSKAHSNSLYSADGNTFTMLAGDVTGNGMFTYTDFNVYLYNSSALLDYNASDLNLDSIVSVIDFNLYKMHQSGIGSFYIRY